MIIKALLELIFGLLQVVFMPINVPPLPDGIQEIVTQLTEILVGAVGLLGVFVDLDVVKFLIPVVLIIVNFDKVWTLIMFILRKIPFIGIE